MEKPNLLRIKVAGKETHMKIISTITTCVRCAHKPCKKSPDGTLDICEFGVAFYNRNGEIIKKEERITLQHISQNLRHEIHKILQLIVAEASKIDSNVSTKTINLESPASRIVGATVIIDQFIEKISGVNDFHPTKQGIPNSSSNVALFAVIDKYSKIYSLIQNTRRSKNLDIEINCNKNKVIGFGSSIIEYVISVIMDNIWKYSLSNSSPAVFAKCNDKGFIDIIFSNTSSPIEGIECLFDKGYQEDRKSEGFGYGLYWSTLLVSHYNESANIEDDLLELSHYQTILSEHEAQQVFALRNIRK